MHMSSAPRDRPSLTLFWSAAGPPSARARRPLRGPLAALGCHALLVLRPAAAATDSRSPARPPVAAWSRASAPIEPLLRW